MIKAALNLVIIFFGALFFVMPNNNFRMMASSQYGQYDWYIREFQSNAVVCENSDIEIAETIKVNFISPKHGIYRNIPYRYYDQVGTSRSIFLKVLSVTNGDGKPLDYTKSYSSGELSIKIGNQEKVITGDYIYIIKYRISNAINYFSDNAEFYFNVNGNNWDVPIERLSAKITLANNTEITSWKYFAGPYGSRDNSRVIVENQNPLTFSVNNLEPKEGLTYVVNWPQKAIPKPSILRRTLWWFNSNGIFLFPVFLLILLLYILYKYGADPKGRGTIIPEFSPPEELDLLQIGILVDEKADNQDFTALIIDLAVKGYIKIKEIKNKSFLLNKKDYQLEKIKDYQDKNEIFSNLMDKIFNKEKSVTLSQLTKEAKLHTLKVSLEKDAYQKLIKANYFSRNPQFIKGVYYGFGVCLIFLAFILPAFLDRYFTYSATTVSILISAILFFIFAKYMPQRTKKGVLIREKIEGFKLYLKTAEKYRMKFYEKTSYFEKYLPYAITLGVADIWAKKFESIYKKPPEWYEGDFVTFSVYSFTENLNNQFSSSVKSAFASTPASSGSSGFSSGGGFSGGGFGGGGGGSW